MGGQSYERYVKKGTPCWKVIVNILFSHVGLVLLVIGYAAGGAKVFMWLEQEREELVELVKSSKTKDVNDAVDYLKQQFWQYGTNEIKYNYTRNEFKDAVYQDLKALERFVLEAANEYGYDGTDEFSRDFSFASSILFTITIMTTVGYGHIAPKTMASKMFCIAYALVGIPLMLVFMGKIGDWLAVTFRWLYSRIFCRCCRARRRDSELPPDVDRKGHGINNDEVGKERYMPTDLVMVPIMINLMVIFIFIFLGALMFSFTSGWFLLFKIKENHLNRVFNGTK
ncbi:TWiK family of potassium channels protein 7 [Eurytemora carolleeae]|uniref:TWiK family of potassium channels protein 7 n=1 Tax=Eurytemora carolleeae TaxID=1294199 RepID=UPI000C76C9BB|nr:TWiK family of potassium channels protein 7 [Eurytemora carolleeae]|eukprot:XP_023330975.1 TWiK family of potassium channels protein 7-like [Eurytemora affinis]